MAATFQDLNNLIVSFRSSPMPLPACLTLRDALCEKSAIEDVLWKIYPSRVDDGSGLSDPKLASILAGTELGVWSLALESIEFIAAEVRRLRPTAIAEFGSGVSTIVFAHLMDQLYPGRKEPSVFSIEQSAEVLEEVEDRLQRCGLCERVRFLHAPLIRQSVNFVATNCYRLPAEELPLFFGHAKPELVLVDGPAGDYGDRFGTVPLIQRHLHPNAMVYMDDALRDSELATADRWSRLGYLDVKGVAWVGKGFLVARNAAAVDASGHMARIASVAEQSSLRPPSSLPPPGRISLPAEPSDNNDVSPAPKLKIYTDSRYLPPGGQHVPLLIPFWGALREDPADPTRGRFDKYQAVGQDYFDIVSPDDADVALLPAEWSAESADIVARLSEEANGKPIAVFYCNDSDAEISVPNGIVFHTSINRSTRAANCFAMPGWSEDFVASSMGGRLPLRSKKDKPSIGFCGLVPPEPAHVRRRAIEILNGCRHLEKHFIVREHFWGSALQSSGWNGRTQQVRQEFIQNLVDSDYALCMRGAGNFSYRLYEALSCGRIPVFIDTDSVLPYDHLLDWKQYCVWVDEKELDRIGEKIADFHASLTPRDFMDRQLACRKLWEDWLSPEGFFRNFHRHFSMEEDNLEPVSTRTPHVRACSETKAMAKSNKPSIVFLNTYYPNFLASFYSRRPEVLHAGYAAHRNTLLQQCFGDSDFYSEGMKKAGWNAEDLVVNCEPLQQAWARENGLAETGLGIALRQIARIKPDVVYFQDLGLADETFLRAIRPHTRIIAGQIASPVPPQSHLKGFDILFTSFPHFAERFRRMGITAYYQPLAFEPRVLQKLPQNGKRYPVTFVGGISPVHKEGTILLEKIAGLVPMDFWGYGAEMLPGCSIIRKNHHGEAWGLDMFSVLRQSFITINRHIDAAENFANNMRLFEATGCGALLVTDYRDNLDDLFAIGKEVVAYRSPEECAALVQYYLSNPAEAEEIARAGQARTLGGHTYTARMEQTAEILERHLRYGQNDPGMPDFTKISYGKQFIEKSAVSPALASGWKDERIPERQRALAQFELAGMYAGQAPHLFRVLAECLRPILSPGSSVLEIGCASGYYYEVLEYLLGMRLDYTGVDYSEPLIRMAKSYYPRPNFLTADGAKLPFGDGSFFAAISSGILLHVPNYADHAAETARVAERFVVAHRIPVCREGTTRYMKKYAYEVETVELLFNEQEILSIFESNGLKLTGALQYYSNPREDSYELTYLFRKV